MANVDALSHLPLNEAMTTDINHLINMPWVLDNVPLMFTDVTLEIRQDGLLSKVLYYTTHGWSMEIKYIEKWVETTKFSIELIFKTKSKTELDFLRPIVECHKKRDSVKMQVFKEEDMEWVRNFWKKIGGNYIKLKILKVISVTTYLVEVHSAVKILHFN